MVLQAGIRVEFVAGLMAGKAGTVVREAEKGVWLVRLDDLPSYDYATVGYGVIAPHSASSLTKAA